MKQQIRKNRNTNNKIQQFTKEVNETEVRKFTTDLAQLGVTPEKQRD